MPLSFTEWVANYVPQLQAAGVCTDDAYMAAQLGADIAYTHQACYGDDGTKVDFDPFPRKIDGVTPVCSCTTREQDGTPQDVYVVHAMGIARRVDLAWNMAGRVPDRTMIQQSIAVHEVRHRVQERNPALKWFRREHVMHGRWTDAQALVVAHGMFLEYNKDIAEFRQAGRSERVIQWITADREFDADVVERLFLHRVTPDWTVRTLANHVMMDEPTLS